MMQVTGEEGVSMEDFITYQKSLFVDMVYLQQDAFDEVDSSAPLERQKLSFNKVYQLTNRSYSFKNKKDARDYFTRLTGLFKNYNYAATGSPEHDRYLKEIDDLAGSIPENIIDDVESTEPAPDAA
jgi:V/A-type H+-transporting ATPase subunit A